MYPANKEKDSGASGTGIYYQAIPAVSADGKNIMKLIPVRMVNGQFFQTEISGPRTDSTPQDSLRTQVFTKAHSAPQLSCKKQISPGSTLSGPVDLDHGYSLNRESLQQQIFNLTTKVHSISAPATNCDKSAQHLCRLPVTVKSPALPKGHHILIPPNALVQTVPASELLPGIQKQICNSSDNSSPGSDLQSVVFVSPVTTVNHGTTSHNDSQTSNRTSRASQSKVSKPHLKLVPKVSQRPNSPIKWVIEEVNPPEQNRSPPAVATENLQAMASQETSNKHYEFMKKLPSLSSEIFQSLAERETANKTRDSVKKTISQSILNKSGQEQENALVMCNGKVFLMIKKCSLPLKMGQNDPTVLTTKSHEANRTTLPAVRTSVKPVQAQPQPDVSIVIPDESDDIIDLCDDEDSTEPDASVEEDNVIFVSYIPPKAASTSQTYSVPKRQMAPEKEQVQMDTSSSNSLIDENHLDDITHVDDGDQPPFLRGSQSDQSVLAGKFKSASDCVSAVMNKHEDSNVTRLQSTSDQQVESVNAEVEPGHPADPNTSDNSSETSSQKEDPHQIEFSTNPATQWASSMAPKPCFKDDHLLRKQFGITANVNICLQRIDEMPPCLGLEQPLQIQSISTSCLQAVSSKSQETNIGCVKKLKLLKELQSSAHPATPAPHTDVTSKNERKCQSGQNSLCNTFCEDEVSPMFSYVEPIEEDFLSTHEDTTSKLQTCVKLNTSTRRLGRTRKRTMCPCCTAGTLDPEAVKLASTAEQIRKKEGRTKAPGKD